MDVESISPMVFTEARSGSFPLDLVGATRRLGYVPYSIESFSELAAQVQADQPVIVLQNLGLTWLPRWHFAVLTGYDLAARTVTLHTGQYASRRMSLDTFLRTWRRASLWAHIILPVDATPDALPQARVLDAIASLERIGESAGAQRAYRAARSRFPDSASAALGEGNAAAAAGDLQAAERALLAALGIDPQNAPAANNLAYVLADQDRIDEAIELIEPRLERAGRWKPVLERTLDELRSRANPPVFQAVSGNSSHADELSPNSLAQQRAR